MPEMTGVLLAAGVGSRLRPLTATRPKCLLDLCGTTLLERTLRAFHAAGIGECILVTGYLHHMIEEAVQTYDIPLTVRFVHNDRYETTNNNYSLWLAGPSVGDRGFVMMDADILFHQGLLRSVIESPHPDALIVREGPVGAEEIKVECAGGIVTAISKEVDPARAVGESIGIEKFSSATARSLFAILERRKDRYEFYEASFQELIDRGAAIRTVASGTFPCMEIDTPQDLEAAQTLARALKA